MLQEFTKNILEKHGVYLNKKMGQSQLIDKYILERIVKAGELSPEDTVLEVGAGIGNLTDLLIRKAGKVIAIEKDARLYKILNKRFPNASNLELILNDVLNMDLPDFDKVISNLPFQISSEITFKILGKDFDFGVLMYQKEFAERMNARVGEPDYGRLTINVYYRAYVEEIMDVVPSAFLPKPEVDSKVLKLIPREHPFKVDDEDLFSRVVLAAFQHRRQKLRNALMHSFEVIFPDSNLSRREQRVFLDENLPEELANSRPSEISPEDFGYITNILMRISL